ncbi:MAG: hypothetical protein ACE5EW_04970 [Thermoplasmata archaeon]
MAGRIGRAGIAAIVAGVLIGSLAFLLGSLRWPSQYFSGSDLDPWGLLAVVSAYFLVMAGIVLFAVSTRKG